MALAYLDASAIVKLGIREAESAALRDYLDEFDRLVSCGLARTEVPRAIRRSVQEPQVLAGALLASFELVPLTSELLDEAANVVPPEVRSLDAIHVAAALTFGTDLDVLITYDTRMTDAAESAGLRVERPGAPPRRGLDAPP